MRRVPTNFGLYEREYEARVSLARRILKAVVQLILAAAVVALAGTFLFPLNAHAGRSCEQVKPTAASVMKGMQLAERTAQQLDASGARVGVLARAGQDLSKYGLRYSHLGLAPTPVVLNL